MKLNRDVWNDIGLLIIRITFSTLLLFHGWHKVLHGLESSITRLEDFTFLPGVFAYFIYIAEILAPLLIILGLYTRLAALSIFATMTIVIYIVTAPGVTISSFGVPSFETQAFYWLFSAALVCTGAGRYRIQLAKDKGWWFE